MAGEHRTIEQWVALSERVPTYDDGLPVLAVTQDKYGRDYTIWNYDADDEGWKWKEVTHWMPLPKMPESK